MTTKPLERRTESTSPNAQKVQVLIYRKTGNAFEVLLLLLTPERGGYWQPVTGGVEPGEVLEAAALREAAEETSLEFRAAPVSLNYQFTFEARGRVFEEHVFALETVGSTVRLDPREHTDFRWVEASKASSELRHESNIEGLRRLLGQLGGTRAP